MTQPIEHLSAAGPYGSAGGTTLECDDTPDFLWKHSRYFASVLMVASFTFMALLFSGAIMDAVHQAYFFVLRTVGVVSGFAEGMMPPV